MIYVKTDRERDRLQFDESDPKRGYGRFQRDSQSVQGPSDERHRAHVIVARGSRGHCPGNVRTGLSASPVVQLQALLLDVVEEIDVLMN